MGNYTPDAQRTWLGTAGEIGAGFAPGWSTFASGRDLVHDVTHWEWSVGHAVQTGGDLLGLVPFARGITKGAGAAVRGLRGGADVVQAATRFEGAVAKSTVAGSSSLFDASGRLVRNGSRPILGQAALNDCGPTSVGMILDTLKPSRISTNLVNLMTSAKGVTMDRLAALLRQNGVNAVWSAGNTVGDIARLTASGNPVIAAVRAGTGGHAVVVDGVTTRMGQLVVAIRDPGNGGTQYFQLASEFAKNFIGQIVFVR